MQQLSVRWKALYFLLLAGPVAVAAELLGASPVLVFAASALALVPLARLLGDATEELAAYTGPRIGGLQFHQRLARLDAVALLHQNSFYRAGAPRACHRPFHRLHLPVGGHRAHEVLANRACEHHLRRLIAPDHQLPDSAGGGRQQQEPQPVFEFHVVGLAQ